MNELLLTQLCLECVRLRQALGYFIDDERFSVAIGGNPQTVDLMLARVRKVYEETKPERID